MTSPVQRIIVALKAADIDAYDGEPTTTPAGRYVAIWDDTGLRQPDNYAGQARSNDMTFLVMCVAKTTEGLRGLVEDVADVLTGLRLDGDRHTSPLHQEFAAPELIGGPTGDKRRTKTLTYTATFPRRGATPTTPPLEELTP